MAVNAIIYYAQCVAVNAWNRATRRLTGYTARLTGQSHPAILFTDASEYFTQTGLPEPLTVPVMRFVQQAASDNGELVIGSRTQHQLCNGRVYMQEAELELLYRSMPSVMNEYGDDLLMSLGVPTGVELDELTPGMQAYSEHAKRAYIVLRESAVRMIYGMRYEDAGIRRMRLVLHAMEQAQTEVLATENQSTSQKMGERHEHELSSRPVS